MMAGTPRQGGMNAESHTFRQAGTVLIVPLRPRARRLRVAAESIFATDMSQIFMGKISEKQRFLSRSTVSNVDVAL